MRACVFKSNSQHLKLARLQMIMEGVALVPLLLLLVCSKCYSEPYVGITLHSQSSHYFLRCTDAAEGACCEWWVVAPNIKDESKCASTTSGALYAMITGMTMTLLWSADSWVILPWVSLASSRGSLLILFVPCRGRKFACFCQFRRKWADPP